MSEAMEAHNFETVVKPDGSIDVRPLHLTPGLRVRQTILSDGSQARTRESFIGSVSRFDRPDEPAAESGEWEAISDPDSILDPNRRDSH